MTTTFQGAPDRTRFPPNAASLTLANEIRVQTSMIFTEAPSPNTGIGHWSIHWQQDKFLQFMDATLAMDAMAPALSQKIKTSRPVSWGPWRAKPAKKVGGIFKLDSTGKWVSWHPSTVPPGARIYLPNRLVNQTAKRLVEAQPSPLCLPGSGWMRSWKDIQPQT